MTAIGRLASPTYYSGHRDVGTGMMHHHNAVKALFAGFRSRGVSTAVPSPSWALSVTEVAAPCCLIVRLILACSAVQRSYTALRRTRTPQGASVRLFLTHACCSPCCVAGSRPEMSHQWHADHARCLAALRNAVVLTGVLLAGANLSCGCQQLKRTAPPEIAAI